MQPSELLCQCCFARSPATAAGDDRLLLDGGDDGDGKRRLGGDGDRSMLLGLQPHWAHTESRTDAGRLLQLERPPAELVALAAAQLVAQPTNRCRDPEVGACKRAGYLHCCCCLMMMLLLLMLLLVWSDLSCYFGSVGCCSDAESLLLAVCAA